MDAYMSRIKEMPLCGIKASYWLDFFKIFRQDATESEIFEALGKLRSRVEAEAEAMVSSRLNKEEILSVLSTLERSWFA